ncbi:hypothetical protein PV327_008825 [Microctonus hyperodae]|uniref:Uncharacterized protein n=1 Tax=Microctonus hyperodae TaxID=165561 RepID=A0AA39FT72_MICHY|nr:hypothetical protein PV327_008825 [Microctonus hyperodae]
MHYLETHQTKNHSVLKVVNRYWHKPNGRNRVWLQQFDVETASKSENHRYPLRWNCRGHVFGILDRSYLFKRENIPFQVGPNVLSPNHMNKDQGTYEMDQNNEQIMNPQAGPSTRPDSIQKIGDKTDMKLKKNERPITYHVETLVFISKGVTDI